MTKATRGFWAPAFFILLPAVAVTLYALFFYSPIYASRSLIMVRSSSASIGVGNLLNMISGSGGREQEIVLNYLKSRDLLEQMAKKYNLMKRYSASRIDFYNRYKGGNSNELFMEYMRKMIATELDSGTRAIRAVSLSFDPELAHDILEDMIGQAKKYVLKIDQELVNHQISVLRRQLENAKGVMNAALEELYKFRKQHRIISTDKEFGLLSKAFSKLLEKKVLLELEVDNKSKQLSQNSPTLQRLKRDLDSVNHQIEREKRRIFKGGQKSLNDIDMRYRILSIRFEIAKKIYETIKGAYENINIRKGLDATQLVVIERPSTPDYPKYPRPFRVFLISLLLFTAAFYTFRLLYQIIMEHR